MKYQPRFGLSIIMCCLAVALSGQLTPCSMPAVMQNDCLDACVVCDLNGLSSRNGHTVPGSEPPGYCTMVVHSIRYLAFIAGSTDISFNVTVFGCTVGTAIELGVYETTDCVNFDLVSNCNTFMPQGNTYSFSSIKPLKIGCPYYIVIDGNGPADCGFTVAVTSGSGKAPTPSIKDILGKKQVCLGDIEKYTLKDVFGACDVQWNVTGATLVTSDEKEAEISFDVKGIVRICATGNNACLSGTATCIDVKVGEESEPQDVEYFICSGAYIELDKLRYYAGTYELKYKNASGCDSIINLLVQEDQPIQDFVDSTICYPTCITINGKDYCNTAQFNIVLPSKIAPFCDSNLFVNLNVLRIEPKIHSDGDLNCFKIQSRLRADSSRIEGNGKINYFWFNEKRDTIGRDSFVDVFTAGKYSLLIQLITPKGKICEQQQDYTLMDNSLSPEIELIKIPIFCENEVLLSLDSFLTVKNKSGSIVKYYSVFPFTTSNEIKLSQISFTSDTSLYVYFFVPGALGNCADTLQIPIHISPSPTLDIRSSGYCRESVFHLSDLQLLPGSPADSLLGFYSCVPPNAGCSIQDSLVILNDTTIYAEIQRNGCKKIIAHTIRSKKFPKIRASQNKKDFCIGEKIFIRMFRADTLEDRKIEFEGIKFNHQDTILELSSATSGIKDILFESDLLGCLVNEKLQVEIHDPEIFPDVQCYSTDSSVLFTWRNLLGRSPFRFDNLSGQNFTFVSNDSILFKNLSPGQKIHLRFHAMDSICGFQQRDLECEAISCPPITIQISGPDSLCVEPAIPSPLFFQAQIQNPQTDFTGEWRGPGILDNKQGIFDASKMQEGLNKIEFYYYKGSCLTIVDKFIFISYLPKVSARVTDTVCQDSLLQIEYTGNYKNQFSFSWDFANGQYSKITGIENYEIRWNSGGTKKLSLNVSNYNCVTEWEKDIYVIPFPLEPNFNCTSNDTSITIDWSLDSFANAYRIEADPAYPYVQLSPNQRRYYSIPPDTEIRFRIYSALSSLCEGRTGIWHTCKTTHCAIKNVLQDTALQFCINQFPNRIDLSNFLTENFNAVEYYVNGNRQTKNINFNSMGIGKHKIVAYYKEGPCFYSDSLYITLHDIPILSEAIIDPLRCDSNQIGASLTINIKGSQNNVQYILNNTLQNSTGYFDQLKAGKYNLKIRNEYNCETDTSFELFNPEYPIVELGPDKIIQKGELTKILSNISGTYDRFTWNNIDGLSCPDCLQPFCSPAKTTMYILTVINQLGCRDEDTIWIFIIDNRVYVPNIFSPNGDNINDEFTLFGTDDLKEIEQLNIFDRWGELLFSKRHFLPNQQNRGWDGKFKNKPVIPGTYVYTAKVKFTNGEIKSLNGEIQLLR